MYENLYVYVFPPQLFIRFMEGFRSQKNWEGLLSVFCHFICSQVTSAFCPQAPTFPLLPPQHCSHDSSEPLPEYSDFLFAGPPNLSCSLQGGSVVKNPPIEQMQKTWVQSLGLEEEMAAHSSICAWEIPWPEEPGRLQSMQSQRVGHEWATEHTQTTTHPPYCFHPTIRLDFLSLKQVSEVLSRKKSNFFFYLAY